MTTTPGSCLRPAVRRGPAAALRPAVTAVALALSLAACSGAGVPPSGGPENPASESPGSSGSGSPGASAASVGSAAEAIAAVGRFDSNFLGYIERNPDVIGQSAWVETKAAANGFELTFFHGAGDCPAGCIERSFIKFFVGRDGHVEKRCEWEEGTGSSSTPC